MAKIDGIFWPVDAEVIRSIPLSIAQTEDMVVGHFDNSGTYSVKLLYKLALDRKLITSGGTKSGI